MQTRTGRVVGVLLVAPTRFDCCTYSSEVRKEPPLRAVTTELRRHPMFTASTAPLIGPNSLFEILRATQALSSGALYTRRGNQCGALEACDLGVFEHCSERLDALIANVVAVEAVTQKGEAGRYIAEDAPVCLRALAERRALAAPTHLSEVTALHVSASHSSVNPAVV